MLNDASRQRDNDTLHDQAPQPAAPTNSGSADPIVDLRTYRRWRERRRVFHTSLDGNSGELATETEDVIRFARTWAPYGGAPDEEIFTRFGMAPARFAQRLWQILISESTIDRRLATQLTQVYRLDGHRPSTDTPAPHPEKSPWQA
jgi:hypothetical protein